MWFYFVYIEGAHKLLHSFLHSFCFSHSQVRLYHVISILCFRLHSGESTRNITAAWYAWYLGACGYCSNDNPLVIAPGHGTHY